MHRDDTQMTRRGSFETWLRALLLLAKPWMEEFQINNNAATGIEF